MGFTLPKISTTNIVMWKFLVDDSAKGGYDMILVRYHLTSLGVNFKFSDYVIKAYHGPFKGSTSPMVDLGAY